MRRSRALAAGSEEFYEEKRWQLIFEDISNRPGLERAQAEAIVCRAQGQTGATDERKRELRKRVEARFGVTEPVRPPLLALVEQPEVGQQRLFGEEAAETQPESQTTEPATPRKAREKLNTKKKTAAKVLTRKKRTVEAHRVAQSTKSQFEHLVIHMGFDEAHAALDALKRRYGIA